MSLDLDAALEQSALPERTVQLCLRGDLQARFDDLERELAAVHRNAPESLAGNPDARALAEQIQALEAEMAAATVTVKLRGITNTAWLKVVREHPPRDGVAIDRAMGFNLEDFYPALVKACLLEVTDEQWTKLYDKISAGQFEQLSDAALDVARREVNVPKSLRASAALQSSDATSSSPAS